MNQTNDTNKRVAEICKLGPFETFNNKGKQSKDGKFLRYKYCLSGGWYEWRPIPNYTESLDAMAEAEKTLNQSQCFEYRDLLQDMVLKEVAQCSTDFTFGATAAQRAAAFLAVVEGLSQARQ